MPAAPTARVLATMPVMDTPCRSASACRIACTSGTLCVLTCGRKATPSAFALATMSRQFCRTLSSHTMKEGVSRQSRVGSSDCDVASAAMLPVSSCPCVGVGQHLHRDRVRKLPAAQPDASTGQWAQQDAAI